MKEPKTKIYINEFLNRYIRYLVASILGGIASIVVFGSAVGVQADIWINENIYSLMFMLGQIMLVFTLVDMVIFHIQFKKKEEKQPPSPILEDTQPLTETV